MQISRSLESEMNEETKRWLTYAGILIVGLAVGYIYMQSQSSGLSEQISKLEAQVTEQKTKAETAAVEVQIWGDEVLHATAYFPSPQTLSELNHSAQLSPGEYRVTYSVIQEQGEVESRFEQQLVVELEGRYFLDYDLY